MFKHRRKIVAFLAIILAALIILSIVAMALPAFAVTQSDLDALKKKNNALAANKKTLDNELYSIRSDKKTAIREKENLDKQIENLDDQIETNELLITALEEEIGRRTEEIALAKDDEIVEYTLFKKRVRAMEETSHSSQWAVLLGAQDFSDFLATAEVVGDIITYDRNLMQKLKETREGIEEAKRLLDEDKVFYETLLADLETQREEAKTKKAEQEKFIEQLQSEEKYTAEQLADIAKEIEASEKEIDRISKELAKRKIYVGGDYIWPLPAENKTITSPFGYRTHPVTKKKNSLHTGTDIAAKTGTKIYAANGGTVIVATYSNSWGNYVMIDHGGGNVTLYAHMSKMATSVGKEVGQGDVIGYVGSTGWSTGPHLHFEIRVNGTPTDPMKIFKLQTT